jgi:hypothetical protein
MAAICCVALTRPRIRVISLHADQAHLARLSFPLGAWRKADVRALAARHGLPAAERARARTCASCRRATIAGWWLRPCPSGTPGAHL